MYAETDQEKEIKQYLLKYKIAFEQHKRISGCGGKTWIVDFYLPEYSVVIEAKMVNFLKARVGSENTMGGIYKDLYKLDELIRRYNLIGILMLEAHNYQIPKRFIANINAHRIFYIWELSQIMPILQTNSIERFNKIPTKELIEITQPMPPEPIPTSQIKEEKPVVFTDKDMQTLYDWTHGKSLKKLGLHPMQINRLVRKFVKRELKNVRIEASK